VSPRAARISRGQAVLVDIEVKASTYEVRLLGEPWYGSKSPTTQTRRRYTNESIRTYAELSGVTVAEVENDVRLAQLLRELNSANATDLADAMVSGQLSLDECELFGMVRGAGPNGLPVERREPLVRRLRDRLTRMV